MKKSTQPIMHKGTPRTVLTYQTNIRETPLDQGLKLLKGVGGQILMPNPNAAEDSPALGNRRVGSDAKMPGAFKAASKTR